MCVYCWEWKIILLQGYMLFTLKNFITKFPTWGESLYLQLSPPKRSVPLFRILQWPILKMSHFPLINSRGSGALVALGWLVKTNSIRTGTHTVSCHSAAASFSPPDLHMVRHQADRLIGFYYLP